MKTLHPFLLASFLPCFLFCGCGKPDLNKEIIGQWDCTDLSWNKTEARTAATKLTWVFRDDGTCLAYWTLRDGSRGQEDTDKFSLNRDRLVFNNENVVFRVSLRGDLLKVVLENRGIDPKEHGMSDDTGTRITFRRQGVSPSVPRKR